MTRSAIALCFIVLVLSGCSQESQLSSDDSNPSASLESVGQSDDATIGNDRTQDFGEFSFAVPKGWTVVPPDREKTLVILLEGGSNWQTANAMIKVDAGKAAVADAHELAKQAAIDFGGTVSSSAESFDGIEAVRVDTPSKSKDAPRRVTMVIRNGIAYLVMAAANDDSDINNALDSIQKSWKWH